MRHLVKGRKLGRTSQHRAATLRALSIALIKEHRIVTTLPKAKELRTFFEPLLTRAKEDTSNNRRRLFGKLHNKEAVTTLFDEIAPKAMDRPGGYTRVIKIGQRSGDGAEMAVIELVDYNDIKPEQKSGKRKRTRRSGRKKKTTPAQPDKPKQQKEEEQEAEEKAEQKAEAEEVEEAEEERTKAQQEESASEADTSEEETTEEDDEANNK